MHSLLPRGGLLDESLLIVVPSAELFFYELITQSIDHQDIDVSDPATHYVTTLLAHRLVHIDKTDNDFGTTIVEILNKSLENPDKRNKLMRDIGETALVITGMFYDHLLRRRISSTYYVEMGQQAYQTLAGSTHPPHAPVYGELARKFPGIVRVLNEVADKTMYHRDEDLARIYTAWMQTGDSVLELRLLRKGIPLQIRKEKNMA